VSANRLTLQKVFPYLVVAGGIIGLVASFILTRDVLAILHNPHYVPACNLNPVFNCGKVINESHDTIFGVQLPIFGIGLFAVLIAAGAGMLAGAKYKRWYWLTFQTLMTLGTIGAYYLLAKSAFQIHALCPFCLSMDVVATTLLWYTTLYNIDTGAIRLRRAKAKAIYGWVRRHHLDILITWFLIVIGILLHQFWYYYGKIL